MPRKVRNKCWSRRPKSQGPLAGKHQIGGSVYDLGDYDPDLPRAEQEHKTNWRNPENPLNWEVKGRRAPPGARLLGPWDSHLTSIQGRKNRCDLYHEEMVEREGDTGTASDQVAVANGSNNGDGDSPADNVLQDGSVEDSLGGLSGSNAGGGSDSGSTIAPLSISGGDVELTSAGSFREKCAILNNMICVQKRHFIDFRADLASYDKKRKERVELKNATEAVQMQLEDTDAEDRARLLNQLARYSVRAKVFGKICNEDQMRMEEEALQRRADEQARNIARIAKLRREILGMLNPRAQGVCLCEDAQLLQQQQLAEMGALGMGWRHLGSRLNEFDEEIGDITGRGKLEDLHELAADLEEAVEITKELEARIARLHVG